MQKVLNYISESSHKTLRKHHKCCNSLVAILIQKRVVSTFPLPICIFQRFLSVKLRCAEKENGYPHPKGND